MKYTPFKQLGMMSLLCITLCCKSSALNAAEDASAPVVAREDAEVRPGRGEDFNTGKFLVNFSPVIFYDYIGDTKPAQGAVYVVIEFTYKNITKKPISASSAPDFFLKDESGTKYDPDVQGNIAWSLKHDDDEKVLSDINPRISIHGCKVFEIAREAILEKGWKVYVDAPFGDDDFEAPFEVYKGDFAVHAGWHAIKSKIVDFETRYLLSSASAEELATTDAFIEYRGSALSDFIKLRKATEPKAYALVQETEKATALALEKKKAEDAVLKQEQEAYAAKEAYDRKKEDDYRYGKISLREYNAKNEAEAREIRADEQAQREAQQKVADRERADREELRAKEEAAYHAGDARDAAESKRLTEEADARQKQQKELREARSKQREQRASQRDRNRGSKPSPDAPDAPDAPAAPDANKDLDEAGAALDNALKKFPFGR